MKNLLMKTIAIAAALCISAVAAQAEKTCIPLAETASDDLEAFLVALDSARANGLDFEPTVFPDVELLAVLSGVETPYAAMARAKAQVRIICQLSKLKFFPVTTKKYSSLENLDAEPIFLHSRDGGTDVVAHIIECCISQ